MKKTITLLGLTTFFLLCGLNLAVDRSEEPINSSPTIIDLKIICFFNEAFAKRAAVSQGFCGGVICECPLSAYYCNGSEYFRDGMCWGLCEVHLSTEAVHDYLSCYSSSANCF